MTSAPVAILMRRCSLYVEPSRRGIKLITTTTEGLLGEDLRLLKAKSRRCPILSSDLTARWRNDAVHAEVLNQLTVMVGNVP